RGIGSALVRESLRRMRNAGASGIVLVGDPGFYARFGFGNARGLVYQDVPDRYVLAADLAGSSPTGRIIAHTAFDVSDI
ncbi:MAG: GNAT family N-acetyltransferase, partial [Desulfovibrio sp.]|nr:GNAT family N-acetyltransferase [Desulfovibrio sp.]